MIFERLRTLCRPRIAVPVIVAVGLIVYLNALSVGFVWDDKAHLLDNVRIHTFQSFFSQFLHSNFYFYHPVGDFAHTTLYVLFGPSPAAFVAFQLLTHILVAITLYLLLRRFIGNEISFALAILFLVHPINVEAVLIKVSLESLSALFGLCALLLLTRKLSNATIFGSLLLLACSLYSKESGFVFLIVAPLYAYLLWGRLPRVFLWGNILILFSRMLYHSEAPYYPKIEFPDLAMIQAPLVERLLSVPKMIMYYVQMLVYPDVMAIWWNWIVSDTTLADFWGPLLMCLGLGVMCIALSIRIFRAKSTVSGPFAAFFILFVLSLGIHMQIVPLDMTVADRWFYTPFIALIGMIGFALWHFDHIGTFRRIHWGVLTLLFVVALTGLSARTIARITNWHDAVALFGHDLIYNRDHSRMYNNFGIAYLEEYGANETALRIFTLAQEASPLAMTPYINKGFTLMKMNRMEEAAGEYRKAFARGDSEELFTGLGTVYLRLPPEGRAVRFLEYATRRHTRNPVLWDLLSVANYQYDRPELALIAHNIARQLQPWTSAQSEEMDEAFNKRLTLTSGDIHMEGFERHFRKVQ